MEPNIPPVEAAWGVPNILLVGCAAFAPKANPVPTGLGCPNDVLGFEEPNNPVFPTIDAFCCPNNPPLEAGVAVGVPKSEVPPVLKPKITLLYNQVFKTIMIYYWY